MKPKDEKKLAAIAAATYALVGERGLAGLTLADIARRAGVATSTLYVYYDSRETLLDTLYHNAKQLTFQRWLEHDDASAPFKARVRGIWHNMLQHRLERYAELQFQEQYHVSQMASPANRELSARFGQFYIDFLALGQRSEVLKAVPAPFLIASITGSVKETANQIRAGALPDDETTRSTAFTLCWDAIKA
ncbi:MAG: TetR/AcrR family transcriptional regulator [Pseudomonadota bacterium]